MSSDRVTATVATFVAAASELAELDCNAFTHTELVELLGELETITWQLPAVAHRMISRLQREASPVALGAKSLKSVLTERLRISGTEAQRRLSEAAELGARVALTGEPLAPLLAQTADARAVGAVGPEHVAVIRSFLGKLPGWVDSEVRDLSEGTLVRIGAATGPEELDKAAKKLATAIDQDGPAPDDAERARKRFLRMGRQQADGMTPITGLLDPQGRASLEPIVARLAAPGMCNPDDEEPCTSGTPGQEQVDGDTRSPGQRTHDAFTAVTRSALASGELGQHNGLPVTVIVVGFLHQWRCGRHLPLGSHSCQTRRRLTEQH